MLLIIHNFVPFRNHFCGNLSNYVSESNKDVLLIYADYITHPFA